MIDTDALRGELARNRISQSEMAKRLHITAATFYRKMAKGVFNSNEIETMVCDLNIKDPAAIFFCKGVK